MMRLAPGLRVAMLAGPRNSVFGYHGVIAIPIPTLGTGQGHSHWATHADRETVLDVAIYQRLSQRSQFVSNTKMLGMLLQLATSTRRGVDRRWHVLCP